MTLPNSAPGGTTINLNNPQRRVIAVNGSGGAQVLISASIATGYIEIAECPPNAGLYTGGNFAPQGMNVTRADENYVNTYGLAPGVVWPIGDAINKNKSEGIMAFTAPDGTVRPATPLVKLISATATATQVMVTEWRVVEKR